MLTECVVIELAQGVGLGGEQGTEVLHQNSFFEPDGGRQIGRKRQLTVGNERSWWHKVGVWLTNSASIPVQRGLCTFCSSPALTW